MNSAKQYAEAGAYYMGGIYGASVTQGLLGFVLQKLTGTDLMGAITKKQYILAGADVLVLTVGQIAVAMTLLGMILPQTSSASNQLFLTIGVLEGSMIAQTIPQTLASYTSAWLSGM